MPSLGVSQKPVVMPTYPHFLSEDIGVWTRYLQSPIAKIAEVWYDVHVGTPIAVANEAGKMDHKLAAALGMKRIDVVARVTDVFWVIEVKPIANMTAVGQAVAYRRLFMQEFEPRRGVLGVIICDQVDEDIVSICEELGLVVIANLG